MNRIQIFTKDNSLDYEKLLSLKEGWFIEFKEKFNDSNKVSKSISSFLNSYGGYIFIGVKEIKNKSEDLYEYIGLSSEDAKKQRNLIKDTIKRNISPTPFVDIHTITGPIPELKLESEKEILIIDIPVGNNPPYISKSSKIYRRKHDSSEPEEENNRYVIDELYKKSNENELIIQKEINSFNYPDKIDNRLTLSSLNLYFFPVQYPNKISSKIIKIEDLEHLIIKYSNDLLTFDNIYYEGSNIVFRNTNLTTQYNRSDSIVSFNRENFSFKTRIQCSESFTQGHSLDEVNFFNKEYKYIDEYKNLFQNLIFDSISIIDFTEIFKKINIIFIFYMRILKFLDYNSDVKCKIMLSNIHKKIPFLDHELFINHCKKYKLPFYLSKNLEFPEENSLNSMINISISEKLEINIEDEGENEQANSIVSSLPITMKVFDFLSFGIPSSKEIISFYK
ncbi:AlbA family DNA-binding domain-containing protein [Leptospira kanakyensis]|uniref:AlbA family DNA-binding domain-containing protein n=1 Tax=Leptospira kanakyensis TaxID=2484968 RepID=UPI00223E8562|nr:ATP-binding protein [Leptospira kanakyensis]MCW7471747.1 ATP-binding protein [Leptospira kanakyensis]